MIRNETTIQLGKFSLVGCLNTGIYYGVFVALIHLTQIHYLLATSIGYVVGLSNSFVLNKFWTFGTSRTPTRCEVVRFLIVNLLSLLTNIICLRYLVNSVGLIPEIGQAMAIVFSMSTNFLGTKFWTFQRAS